MVMLPQLLMLTGMGAMKSLSSAVNDEDERLFRNVLPKAVHTPSLKTPALVRLIAASPNRPLVRSMLAIGSFTLVVLTAPSALPPSSTCLPQQGSALAE